MHEMRLLQSSDQIHVPQNAKANYAAKDTKGGGNSIGYGKGKPKFNTKPKVVCQLCGKNNHTASKCYKRFDHSFHGLDNQQQGSGQGFSSQPQSANTSSVSPPVLATPPVANFSSQGQGNSNSEWCVDSGATHHITSNLENLHIQTPYSGTSQLIVGKGASAAIKHTSCLHASSLLSNKNVILRNVFTCFGHN